LLGVYVEPDWTVNRESLPADMKRMRRSLHETRMPPCVVGTPHSLSHFTVPSGSMMLALFAASSAEVASRPGKTAMIGVSHASTQWRSAVGSEPALGRTPLTVPAGTSQSIATGINELGQIVGRYSAGTGTVGALWSASGALITLPAPPGTWSYSTPSNINDLGVVCGTATLAQVGVDPEQAWRWTAKSGYTMLPRLGGVVAGCRDINNSGQIAGFGTLSNGQARACVWQPDGTPLQIGVPAGATQSVAHAINNAGTVVGTTAGNEVPWVWDAAGGMRALPDFGFKAAAFDVNSGGWILGWADTAPFDTVPVVWDPQGNLHNVYALVDQSRFYFPGDFIVPVAISDTNLIVVRGYDFTVSGDPLVLLFRIVPPSSCTTDIDRDGQTGASDIAALLSAWGTAGSGGEDLDGSGSVGAADIAVLLSAWGACP